jgi:hypothetical protein
LKKPWIAVLAPGAAWITKPVDQGSSTSRAEMVSRHAECRAAAPYVADHRSDVVDAAAVLLAGIRLLFRQ